MKLHYHILFIPFLSLIITSCGPSLITSIYGMRKNKPVTCENMKSQARKFRIPSENSFLLDSSYISFLSHIDTNQFAEEKKNHFQPLQVLYYNQNGSLISYNVNCSMGGFPNIGWNQHGAFNSFPPSSQTKLDSLLSLKEHLELISPDCNDILSHNEENDFIVILYWSRFMGRQSKKLVKVVQENLQLASNYKVKVLYFNNDNIFAEYFNKN